MTLGELLTECKNTRRDKVVRVFVGCMTIFKGIPSNISARDWVNLSPYFNCKVSGCRTIGKTFVITL